VLRSDLFLKASFPGISGQCNAKLEVLQLKSSMKIKQLHLGLSAASLWCRKLGGQAEGPHLVRGQGKKRQVSQVL